MISTLTGNSKAKILNKDTISKENSARIQCEQVFNVAHGQIVYIGTSEGRAFVNVKCNPSEVLRYGNLKELNCAQSYYATVGAQLGTADDYVIFEYCTRWQGESNYPVRINGYTFFKQDPTDVLEGTYTLRRDGAQEEGYVLPRNRVRFNEEQKAVFGENKLDLIDAEREKQNWSSSKSAKVLRELGIELTVKKPKTSSEDEDADDESDEEYDDVGMDTGVGGT